MAQSRLFLATVASARLSRNILPTAWSRRTPPDNQRRPRRASIPAFLPFGRPSVSPRTESKQEVHMRIIRHSHTNARITEFVKENRARVNIKVTPSLQYTDGIELRASIDDTTTAIVYLRLDDLRMIIDFIRH